MIIAVANQKGGCGKTTTAQAIATGATHLGLKSLAIDFDAQCNLSFSMGGNSGDIGIYELITGQCKPGQAIQHTAQGDIITSNIKMALSDTDFKGDARLYALKLAIEPIKKKYDIITIDCAPTLNTLLLNALMAADKVIIPLTADMFALSGLYQLAESIKNAQKLCIELEFAGVLFTKHNTRTVLSRELTDVIKDKCKEMNIPVLKTTISESVAVREAQTQREALIEYAPKSKPAIEYMALLKELGITAYNKK